MPAGYDRFSGNPFSRITDRYGNDVTHERGAVRTGPLWGARVYPPYEDGTVLIKQTVREGPTFIAVEGGNGRHSERHVHFQDDAALAQAIRDALRGEL